MVFPGGRVPDGGMGETVFYPPHHAMVQAVFIDHILSPARASEPCPNGSEMKSKKDAISVSWERSSFLFFNGHPARNNIIYCVPFSVPWHPKSPESLSREA